MSDSFPFDRVTIVGGSGAVAELFARTLQEACASTVTLLDLKPRAVALRGTREILCDARSPSVEAMHTLETSNLVILAVPEAVAETAGVAIAARMPREALLVDTLSVKQVYAEAMAAAPPGPELLGVNPMFAPGLGFTGRSVAAIPYRAAGRSSAFLDVIRAQGAHVVSLSAEDHDRACASLQAATHAAILSFGISLRSSGYDLARLEPLMPPPHRTMLALLARVLSADPEVYRDIQAGNRHAAGARRDLADALSRLDRLVANEDPAAFRGLFQDLKRLFADARTDYAELCARLFQVR